MLTNNDKYQKHSIVMQNLYTTENMSTIVSMHALRMVEGPEIDTDCGPTAIWDACGDS